MVCGISSCNKKPECYEIPKIDMNIDILRPWGEDSAYVSIYSSDINKKGYDCKFRVQRHECLNLRFVIDLHHPDTIFYYDEWEDITFESSHANYVEYKDFYDPRFFVDVEGNNVKNGYIEVGILDFARYVLYKLDTIPYYLEPR